MSELPDYQLGYVDGMTQGERAERERIVKLIYRRFAEWHDRIPDEQPDWRESCTEIRDAIERGEHNG